MRSLRRQGYKLLVAANGSDALQIAKTYSDGEIAVMVTDLVMPLMGGRELANQITAAHPNIKIIFTSGYSDDETIQQEMSSNDVTFLKKPFAPAELARIVRTTLDK
ncbi:MAG: response regulator [SAR202 cluster bacterium]|nr:response regulator [SAR202 cluster bacterium]HAL47060.1 hypothetical protein [Dehalococcoidia bacterium]